MRMMATLGRAAAVLALPLLLLAAAPAISADVPPGGGRVGTVTRLVKLFLEKEAALQAVVRGGDAAAVGAMLTEDFEMRTGVHPDNPVPRADWIRAMVRTRDPGGDVSQMAVHDYGAVMLVSFTLDAAGGPVFVVDAWRGGAADWKLAVRYASSARAAPFAIPGDAPAEAEIPKKY
jgi:hypothetical protein